MRTPIHGPLQFSLQTVFCPEGGRFASKLPVDSRDVKSNEGKLCKGFAYRCPIIADPASSDSASFATAASGLRFRSEGFPVCPARPGPRVAHACHVAHCRKH
jgi:hypothetical protein